MTVMSHEAVKYNYNEDLTPICNGTGKIQWISLSEYFQTGNITFVEPEQEPVSNNSNQTNKCSICSTLSNIDDEVSALLHIKVNLDSKIVSKPLFFSQVKYLKQEVASANSRAPPYYL